MKRDRVPVAPVRRVVEQARADGMSWSDIAYTIGWTRTERRRPGFRWADTARLKRAIGVLPDGGKYAASIAYRNAVAIVKACNYDPVDADL